MNQNNFYTLWPYWNSTFSGMYIFIPTFFALGYRPEWYSGWNINSEATWLNQRYVVTVSFNYNTTAQTEAIQLNEYFNVAKKYKMDQIKITESENGYEQLWGNLPQANRWAITRSRWNNNQRDIDMEGYTTAGSVGSYSTSDYEYITSSYPMIQSLKVFDYNRGAGKTNGLERNVYELWQIGGF